MKNLGVENGERARYLYEKFQELDTQEEKAALWDEYINKKILTKQVREQLTWLLKNGGQE